MLRLGLIGLGEISRFYIDALNRLHDVVLVAVCDRDFGRLKHFNTIGYAAFTDYKKLLAMNEVDAVIVATPNDQHMRIARDALHAGKHVCCEKPLATCLKDAEEIARTSESVDRILFTAFHRRYNKNLLRYLRTHNERSEIVSVLVNYRECIMQHAGAESWYLDPRKCRGCIDDNGPNAFDLTRFFLGRLDLDRATITLKNGIDMRADLSLSGEAGTFAHILLDWQHSGGDAKDLTIRLKDGVSHHINLLDGYVDFRESLWDEYHGLLQDFVFRVGARMSDLSLCIDSIRLVEAAYQKAVPSDE